MCGKEDNEIEILRQVVICLLASIATIRLVGIVDNSIKANKKNRKLVAWLKNRATKDVLEYMLNDTNMYSFDDKMGRNILVALDSESVKELLATVTNECIEHVTLDQRMQEWLRSDAQITAIQALLFEEEKGINCRIADLNRD